jgi:hypothetical protein
MGYTMNILMAVASGVFLAFLSNSLLDYMIASRGLAYRSLRPFKIMGKGEDIFSVSNISTLESEKIFVKNEFPVCHACHTKIGFVRYFFGGKCPACGASPRKRLWILLLWMPLIFVILTLFPIFGFRIGDIYLLMTFYTMVFVMDVEHRVILLPLTLAGILFGAYFGIHYHGILYTLYGGLAGGAIMLLFYWLGVLYIRQIRKSDPAMNEVALGFGDVSLSLILGLILGWPGILGGLFFGILLGGLISGGLLLFKVLLKKYAPNDLILPYAPFLIIGALLIMIL